MTRRGFTLMELMVVVGIMTFLGLAATNGYNALQKGIAERGAVDAASALLKAAKERALVDRVPTAVFCYNRMLRDSSDNENAVVVGEAVAIRRAGRITKVKGKYLYDEFGDLERSYDSTTKESELTDRKGMRLWRFDDRRMSRMQYSVVADGVYYDDDIGGAWSFMPWGDRLSSSAGGGNSATQLVVTACAFYDLGTSSCPPPSWQVGNGYGFEFQRLRLPDGFLFGSSVPSQVGQISETGAFFFDPAQYANNEQIDIWACMLNAGGTPVAHHRAGTASSRGDAAR